MKKVENKISISLKILYVCIFLSVAVWAFTLFTTQQYFGENPLTGHDVEIFEAEWRDASGNVIAVPGQYEVKPGEDFAITHIFAEDVRGEKSLLFRTDHTYVRAYINGTEIYRFGNQEEIPFGKTPGSGWQLIELGQIAAGDVLTIVQNCPYEKYSGLIRDIEIGTKAELVSEIMFEGMDLLIMTVIPLLIGIVVIILPPFFFREYPPLIFLNMGISFVVISIWSFTEARTWQLFFRNAYAMQMLNFVTFSLFVPCVLLSAYTMGFIKNKRLYQIMLGIDSFAALILLGLQVFEIADYFETLGVVHALIVVNAFMFISSFIRNNHAKKEALFWTSMVLYLIIGLSAVWDLLDFYVWDYFGNGFFTRIEILALLVCAGLAAMRRTMIIRKKRIEQMTYEKMAYTDNLTSLKNRRAFDEAIEQIEREEREVVLVYADMNGLKSVNDHRGHHYGDEAIKLIAEELRRFGSEGAICYRIGGDEFCVLSFHQSPERLKEECEQINRNLRVYEGRFGYPIGISYGIQKYVPGSGMTMHQCLVAVDAAMYEYKQSIYIKQGRGR